jgi:ketosteroid isomerase-like protein
MTATERVVAYLKAIDAHDRDAVRDAYTENVEIRTPGTELYGRQAATAWIDVFLRAFPDIHHDILTIVEVGEHVALEAGVTATHTGPLASPGGDIRPTGSAVTLDYADVFQIADGRIRSEHVYFDQITFLAQLGLPTG